MYGVQPAARQVKFCGQGKGANALLKKTRSSHSVWTENTSIQTKNCVAALLVMAVVVYGFLVRQVWPPLLYIIHKFNPFIPITTEEQNQSLGCAS